MSRDGLAIGRVVVIGGANTDIVGRPDAPLVAHDSNPGRIHSSPGGVGRNIAENLVRLGVHVTLITAFGGDEMSAHLAADCRDLGMDTSLSLYADHLPGSRYMAILDDEGDMAVAASDMRALDALTPEELHRRRYVIDAADLVVADANLPVASLEWMGGHVGAPVLFDPVSTTKARRSSALFGHLHAIKCNVIEAASLLGVGEEEVADVAQAARKVRDLGIAHAIVTAGVAGAFWADADGEGWTPSFGAPVVNATGAGDAFTAGIAYGMLTGLGAAESARFASAAAALTLGAEETVSPAMCVESVRRIMEVDEVSER